MKQKIKKVRKVPFPKNLLGVFILFSTVLGVIIAVSVSNTSTTMMQHAATSVTQLGSGQAFYPRAIRLQYSGISNGHIIASVSTASTSGVTDAAQIFESTDGGTSFHVISEIHDQAASGGRGSCCGSLYELPYQIGPQPAGTLLFGTSVGLPNTPKRIPEIRVWKSIDHGYTWSYLSSCAVNATALADRGLWEPEFSVDSRGYLNCYFSDDTQIGYDQILASVTSTDGGVTWGTQQNIVAIPSVNTTTYRPGMITVRKLPNGTYFMSYELCGTNIPFVCGVRYRMSPDGWNWGNPQDSGTEAKTPDGKRLLHSPTIAWVPGGSPNGRIFLVGQLVNDVNGKILNPASGSVIFVNTENGVGSWYELDLPVKVSFTSSPDQNQLVCNNYSSSLLPSVNGSTLLEIATMRVSDGSCVPFFASGATKGTGSAMGVISGSTYRLQSVLSSNCLDVAAGSMVSGANVQQWTCNGLAPQDWKFLSKGSGYYTLTSKQSGKCLDVAKSSTATGANVDQLTCNNSNAQLWKVSNVGLTYYNIISKVSGKCLDVAGGSMRTGANVDQWTCNNLAPQIWELELR